MVTVIFVAVLAVVGVCFWRALSKKTDVREVEISDVVDEFNNLVNKMKKGKQKPDVIKGKLLDLLARYKKEKERNFTETQQVLTHSSEDIKEQINIINRNIYDATQNARKLKYTDGFEENDELKQEAYSYCNIISQSNEIKTKLEETSKELDVKLKKIKEMVTMFSSKYQLKKSEIIMMISQATTLNNFNDIDITLNDMIKDFKVSVTDDNIANEVKAKMNNVEMVDNTVDVSTEDLDNVLKNL